MSETRDLHGDRFSLWVTYPSGERFQLFGSMSMVVESGVHMCCVMNGEKEAIMIDPRSIVSCGGVVIYSPRRMPAQAHVPAMSKWLTDNPQWDRGGDCGGCGRSTEYRVCGAFIPKEEFCYPHHVLYCVCPDCLDLTAEALAERVELRLIRNPAEAN
jgi:hypothetical protein